jgi:hypothetical protein
MLKTSHKCNLLHLKSNSHVSLRKLFLMKKMVLAICCISISLMAIAQQKPTELDKSPMDMSYWPANYPILKMSGKVKSQPIARVIYGRPGKNGRTIFGGIVKYGDLWRLGANEATEIEFFTHVKIGGKNLSAGRYTIFCIPNESKWTLSFNKDNFCWGSFTYDTKKDIFKVDAATEKNAENVEIFTIYFEDAGDTANLIFLWDDIKASLPITITKKK